MLDERQKKVIEVQGERLMTGDVVINGQKDQSARIDYTNDHDLMDKG